jgi:hypothetical protein
MHGDSTNLLHGVAEHDKTKHRGCDSDNGLTCLVLTLSFLKMSVGGSKAHE